MTLRFLRKKGGLRMALTSIALRYRRSICDPLDRPVPQEIIEGTGEMQYKVFVNMKVY